MTTHHRNEYTHHRNDTHYYYTRVTSGHQTLSRYIDVNVMVNNKMRKVNVNIHSSRTSDERETVMKISSKGFKPCRYNWLVKKLSSRIDEIIELDDEVMALMCDELTRYHEYTA